MAISFDLRLLQPGVFFRSLAISANSSSAACKSSTISAAITSGSGRIGGVFKAFVFQPEDVEEHFEKPLRTWRSPGLYSRDVRLGCGIAGSAVSIASVFVS